MDILNDFPFNGIQINGKLVLLSIDIVFDYFIAHYQIAFYLLLF
jgi:hypothetical protein